VESKRVYQNNNNNNNKKKKKKSMNVEPTKVE